MSGPPPPTFSSFPELPQLRAQPEAGSSKSVVPTFSSFPDLPARDDDKRKRSKRHEEDDRSRRHRSRREEDDRDRSRRRPSKEREKDRHKDKEDRRAKEKRRERERQEAKDLIAGVKTSKAIRRDEEDVLENDRKRKQREEEEAKELAVDDDGGRWYDAPKSESARPSRDQRAALQAPSQVGFFVDTRPDLGNVMYGGLNSTTIPSFSRGGYGHVVGLSEAFKIVRESEKRGKSLEVALGGFATSSKGSSLLTLKSATDHLSKILLHTAAQPPVDHTADFLPLSSHEIQRPRKLSLYANYNDGTEQSLELDLDEDPEVSEARRDRLETLDQRIQRETIEYEHKLKDHPTLIDEWIKYSVLHLKRSPDTADANNPASVKITEANGSITLKILSKALDAHRDNRYSPALHLAYLRSAEMFWPASKVTERWKWVLNDVAGQGEVDGDAKMELWLRYVDWREGQGFGASGGVEGVGGVDETVEVYIECLNMIRHGIIGGRQDELEESMVYLLQRACLFLKHAGFVERATAIYQAMLELTFFKPDRLRQPHVDWIDVDLWRSHLVAGLERFWDAEVARVGEAGAPSWCAAEAGAPPAFRVSQPHSAADVGPDDDPFVQWYKAERHQETHASRPALATDLDLDDEDPYRVILFADVEPFLFVLQSAKTRLQLAYSFLSFLGLPFAPPGATTALPAARDPHLHWSLMSNDSMRSRMWPPMDEISRKSDIATPFDSPVKVWRSDTSDQFARNGQWFRLLEAGELDHVDVEMARNVLQQLRPVITDPGYTSASFVLEAALSPKTAMKMAKESLSADRHNLILWNSYAKLAHQRGKVAEARTVYITALRAALTRLQEAVAQDRTEDTIWLEEDLETLWAGWAEMEFVEGDNVRCQEVLVHACGIKQEDIELEATDDYNHKRPAPDQVLRAFKNLEKSKDRTSHSHLVIRTLMIYQYKSLDDALGLLLESVKVLSSDPGKQEAVLQLRAQLLYNHGLRAPLPAKTKRVALEEAIQLFPNNTEFLSLYRWGETHGKVYGRVRDIVYNLVKVDEMGRTTGGIVSYLWGAWAEAKAAGPTFWAKNSNGQERVRVLLDRGINSAEGRRSAALWKIYIEFEGHCGRSDRAKQLCYRAVSAVGGSKDLYMLPFTPELRPAFTKQEIKAWSELMTERGVRVRVPFDRHWSQEEEMEMEIGDVEEEEPLDDELAFLRERQKLMPY